MASFRKDGLPCFSAVGVEPSAAQKSKSAGIVGLSVADKNTSAGAF